MLATRTLDLPDCRPVLADPDDLTLVFQPVVDLTTATVAGYEALCRFPGTAGPEVWFAAAAEAGVAAELEALAIGRALDAVPGLPDGTFLTVNASPHLLATRPVREAFARRPDLHRVVVELTGHNRVHDLAELTAAAAGLRARGALIALDDTANGYAGLQLMAALRPQLVSLDRTLVAGADADPVRLALAGLVGEFAGRIDARLVAEGLETTAELAAFLRLGVPLGQGWLLGRPTPGFAPLDPKVADLVRGQAARVRLTAGVTGLLRPVRQCAEDADVAVAPAVLVGPLEEPRALLLADARTGETYRAPVSLRVTLSADVAETLHRALARPPAQRFEPVLVTDPAGQVLGLVRVEDLASAVHTA
jgi:EAL domain-containing protein (putative c-di-GMP-specific phosphodiesterase class I)